MLKNQSSYILCVFQDDFSTENIYYECSGTHAFVFLAITYVEDIMLALLSVLIAFETQTHVPKYDKLYMYHESAVINTSCLVVLDMSSCCNHNAFK